MAKLLTSLTSFCPHSELVLTVLLESLVFEPGPELEWEISGIVRSVLKNSTDKTPQTPLKVSLFKEESA